MDEQTSSQDARQLVAASASFRIEVLAKRIQSIAIAACTKRIPQTAYFLSSVDDRWQHHHSPPADSGRLDSIRWYDPFYILYATFIPAFQYCIATMMWGVI